MKTAVNFFQKKKRDEKNTQLTIASSVIGSCVGATVGGLGGALVGAINGAVTSAVGAAILQTSFDGYDIGEATEMGAVGQCIAAAAFGLILGGLTGVLRGNHGQSATSAFVTTAGTIIAGGALGKAIFNDDMELDKLWAASILGYAVIGIPIILSLAVCIFVCGLLTASLPSCTSSESDEDDKIANNL